jgi:uncharacterized protein YqjF (DUF2071 family)
MNLPVLSGVIRRRILVNYQANPEVVQKLLPNGLRPKLHKARTIVGICLIRLEQVRPKGMPQFIGLSSENAAHRIAVEWDTETGIKEAVYIPRRDTNSWLNQNLGGRVFPAELHAADFRVKDNQQQIRLEIESKDKAVEVHVRGQTAKALPTNSIFACLEEASNYFKAGSLGYSASRDSSHLDGVQLQTNAWKVEPLAIEELFSSYFANIHSFPTGSVTLDHALIMRNVEHEWFSTKPYQIV